MSTRTLALAGLLAFSTPGCGYTWRPLQEAKRENRPELGRVVLHTESGEVDMEHAKEVEQGIQGDLVGTVRPRETHVPWKDIRGGAVWEPVLSKGETAGVVTTVVVLSSAAAGALTFAAIACGMGEFSGW